MNAQNRVRLSNAAWHYIDATAQMRGQTRSESLDQLVKERETVEKLQSDITSLKAQIQSINQSIKSLLKILGDELEHDLPDTTWAATQENKCVNSEQSLHD